MIGKYKTRNGNIAIIEGETNDFWKGHIVFKNKMVSPHMWQKRKQDELSSLVSDGFDIVEVIKKDPYTGEEHL